MQQVKDKVFYKDLPDFTLFKHCRENKVFIKVCNAQALTMDGKDAIFLLKDYCIPIKKLKCVSQLYT